MTSNSHVLDTLRWKKFPVGSDGFVCLVDCMGDDAAVTQAARVSYGKDLRAETDCPACGKTGFLAEGHDPPEQSRCPNCEERDAKVHMDDRNLIRYLMRHRHSTPFEMAEVKLLVRVPMDAWRQWIRHRTANVNEYSTRYQPAIDSMATTGPDQWRLQAKNNKQGSAGILEEWPEGWESCESVDDDGFEYWKVTAPDGRSWEFGKSSYDFTSPMTPGQFLSLGEKKNQGYLQKDYNIRLELGVAREVARKDLPLSTYTEAYWKCDLHNILHFLGLRMDKHAQQEIRDYAKIIGEQIIAPLFPCVWEAFSDYRLDGMFLTGLDIRAHTALLTDFCCSLPANAETVVREMKEGFFRTLPEEWRKDTCRERDEFIQKMVVLGLLND
jgi:thymidylate synthase (FAD)